MKARKFCQETKKPGPCKGAKRGGAGKAKATAVAARLGKHVAAAKTSSAGAARVPGTSSGRFNLTPAKAKSVAGKAKLRQEAADTNRPRVPGSLTGRFTMPPQRAKAISGAANKPKAAPPKRLSSASKEGQDRIDSARYGNRRSQHLRQRAAESRNPFSYPKPEKPAGPGARPLPIPDKPTTFVPKHAERFAEDTLIAIDMDVVV